MNLPEYLVLFVLVAIMGAGLPGPGDASLIAAGTLAGEGRLNMDRAGNCHSRLDARFASRI
jgi:membrane protein DedA with SNARE-associated domain